jgi:hypothetical protein
MNYKKIFSIILAVILLLAFAGYVYANYFGGKMPTGSAKLSWNKSDDPKVAGYKIYYGTESRTGDCPSGGYAEKVDVKNVNDFKLGGLTIGKKYYFSVTSYNQAGKESCFSEEMSKRVGFSQ